MKRWIDRGDKDRETVETLMQREVEEKIHNNKKERDKNVIL